MTAGGDLGDGDYRALLAWRIRLRRFLRWSEEQARAEGLSAAQHQLLLAVRGHADAAGPTVADLADALLLRHHSTVGLLDRAAAAGLVLREADGTDRRRVRIRLTTHGEDVLARLSRRHWEELGRAGLAGRLLPGVGDEQRGEGR